MRRRCSRSLFGDGLDRRDGQKGRASLADGCLERLWQTGILAPRLNVDGECTWGALNKLATLNTGLDADFFATSVEHWWNSLVFRTGSKQLNVQIASRANDIGWHWEPYGAGFKRLTADGWAHERMGSEREVFDFVGLPWLAPEERSV